MTALGQALQNYTQHKSWPHNIHETEAGLVSVQGTWIMMKNLDDEPADDDKVHAM